MLLCDVDICSHLKTLLFHAGSMLKQARQFNAFEPLTPFTGAPFDLRTSHLHTSLGTNASSLLQDVYLTNSLPSLARSTLEGKNAQSVKCSKPCF